MKQSILRIPSRTPRVPEPVYAGILGRVAPLYDVSRLVRTDQVFSPARAR